MFNHSKPNLRNESTQKKLEEALKKAQEELQKAEKRKIALMAENEKLRNKLFHSNASLQIAPLNSPIANERNNLNNNNR